MHADIYVCVYVCRWACLDGLRERWMSEWMLTLFKQRLHLLHLHSTGHDVITSLLGRPFSEFDPVDLHRDRFPRGLEGALLTLTFRLIRENMQIAFISCYDQYSSPRASFGVIVCSWR